MPQPTAFKLTGKWKTLQQAFDPRMFDKRTQRYMLRATGINALFAVREIRQVIVRGGWGAGGENKALTVAIKGSTKPLVDRGHTLFQAVTQKIIDYYTAFVGILQTSAHYNIAITLHDGTEIPVTDKMRGLFWLLWLVSIGSVDSSVLSGRAAELWGRMPGGWKPLDPGTRVIVIPSRPFMRRAFASKSLHDFCMRQWHAAIAAALADSAKGRG